MKYLKYVLHAVILIGLVLAAMRYLNSEDVWRALSSFHVGFGLLMLVVPAVQLVMKGWRFEVLLRPFGVCERATVIRAYAAGQPATLLPGGIAARIGLLRQADVPIPSATTAVILSSLTDLAVFVVGLVGLSLAFPEVRAPALIVLGVAAGVALLLVIRPIRAAIGSLVLRLVRRFSWADELSKLGDAFRKAMGVRVIVPALVLSLAALLSDVFLLDVSLRGLGVSVSVPDLFVAYLLPTMLGRISALPAGGIGLAEAGIAGYLTSAAGVPLATAVVAAALFRVATVFLQALYGAFTYWFAWRGDAETVYAAAGD